MESASFTAQSVSGATVEIGGTLPTLPPIHYGYELIKVVSSSETETETEIETEIETETDTDTDTDTDSRASRARCASARSCQM